jgi:hypothetical protein
VAELSFGQLRLFSPQDTTFEPSPSPLQNSKPKLPGNLGEVLIQIDWEGRELRSRHNIIKHNLRILSQQGPDLTLYVLPVKPALDV